MRKENGNKVDQKWKDLRFKVNLKSKFYFLCKCIERGKKRLKVQNKLKYQKGVEIEQNLQ